MPRQKRYPLAPSCRGGYPHSVYAVATGEKRKPKKGEWFLSGAITEAYLAYNDLTTEYPIAALKNDISVRKGRYA